jgi:hypothetical protein
MQNNGNSIKENNNRQKKIYDKTNATLTADGYFKDIVYFFSERNHIIKQFLQK